MSSVSRRTFLATPIAVAIGASITGCTTPPAPVLVDPDRKSLEAALVVEQRLLDETMLWADPTAPTRREVKAVIEVHIDRLVATLGTTPSATVSPTPTANLTRPVTTAALRQAAQRAVASHTRASRAAGPQTAQLLASLAASDAAIAAALTEPT